MPLKSITTLSTVELYNNFQKAKSSDKIPYIPTVIKHTIDEANKPGSIWYRNFFTTLLNCLRSDNTALKTETAACATELVRYLVNRDQNFDDSLQIINAMLDGAGKCSNPTEANKLYQQSFNLSGLLRSDILLPALFKRYEQADDAGKAVYIPVLVKNALAEKMDPSSPWPEKIADSLCVALRPQHDATLKYQAAFGLYDLLPGLHTAKRPYAGTLGSFRQVLGAAIHTHDPQGMYDVAFSLADLLDEAVIVPILLDKFDRAVGEDKTKYIDPLMSRYEQSDSRYDWMPKYISSFSAALQQESETLHEAITAELHTLSLDAVKAKNPDAGLQAFSALLNAACHLPDQKMAAQLQLDSYTLLQKMYRAKILDTEHAGRLATAIISGLNAEQQDQTISSNMIVFFRDNTSLYQVDAEKIGPLAHKKYNQYAVQLAFGTNKDSVMRQQCLLVIMGCLQTIQYPDL